MKLIVVSYPEMLVDEASLINHLFKKGLECFHLRKPDWNRAQVEHIVQQLDSEYLQRVVLHNHFELAKEYQLGGIHFTKKTKPILKKWLTFQGSKSISCHSLEELDTILAGLDYAFLSPVFPSISKEGYSGNLQLSEIKQFLKSYNQCEVVALGGITEERLIFCKYAGFDGAAVLGRIWEERAASREIFKRFLRIKDTCQRIDHM